MEPCYERRPDFNATNRVALDEAKSFIQEAPTAYRRDGWAGVAQEAAPRIAGLAFVYMLDLILAPRVEVPCEPPRRGGGCGC